MKRKKTLKSIALILGLGAIGSTIGIGISNCSNNKPNPTPVDDKFWIETMWTNTSTGVLRDAGDEVHLLARGGKGIISWSETSIEGIVIQEKGSFHDMLYIRATQDLVAPATQLNIIATDENDAESRHNIPIYEPIFENVDFGTEYFSLTTTTSTNDTILGFSDRVIQDPSLLDNFNALDFSEQTNIKYVGGTCKFANSVFAHWQVEKIDLTGLRFLYGNYSSKFCSGYDTFRGADLSSLIQLNFGNSIWYNTNSLGYVYTGSYTFAEANLTGLRSLDLSEVAFAGQQMGTLNVQTAYHTFEKANLSELKTLNLSGTKFASYYMSSSSSIYTASYTFSEADLSDLSNLDLAGAVFADAGMHENVTQTENLNHHTAYYTFYKADLSGLSSLNLIGAKFAATEELNYGSGMMYTADATFKNANLSNISTLDLSGVEFCVTNQSSNAVNIGIITACETFESATLSKMHTLNLVGTIFGAINMIQKNTGQSNLYIANETFYMPNMAYFFLLKNLVLPSSVYYPINNSWVNTFNFYDDPITIHGYASKPSWFGNWFSYAKWSETE